eukprot:33806-Eustigmatos_ZCMA.PRE.1
MSKSKSKTPAPTASIDMLSTVEQKLITATILHQNYLSPLYGKPDFHDLLKKTPTPREWLFEQDKQRKIWA